MRLSRALSSVGFLIALPVARSVPSSTHPTRHNREEAREQTPNLSAGTPPPHSGGIELRFGHHCHARPVWREGWGGWGRCCLYILHRSQCVNFLEPAVLSGGSQFLLPGCVWAKKVQPIGRMDCIFRCTAMCCLLCLVEPSLGGFGSCVWWKLFTVTARCTRGVKVPLLAVSLSPA